MKQEEHNCPAGDHKNLQVLYCFLWIV